MLNKNMLRTFGIIFIIFAIGLIGFYIFSAPYGDGLEKTMEHGEIEESEPVYNAPLDYGDNYQMTLLIGIIGFIVTLAVVLFITWLLRIRNAPQQR